MSPHRHVSLLLVAALLLGGIACRREARRFQEPDLSARATATPRSELRPSATQPVDSKASAPLQENPYAHNAWALSQGQRLYTWFNCVGCHANGGGGMGPALMDSAWIYGGDAASVYESIIAGRPNGMPSFRERMTEQQAWQLVTYVHYLAGNVPPDMVPGRSDSMNKGGWPNPDDTRPKAKPHGGDK